MARRMVIRCDQCGSDADMRNPESFTATSSAMFASGPFGSFDMKPKPPEGWFERFAGLRGHLDFCSVACVSAWDDRHKGAVYA